MDELIAKLDAEIAAVLSAVDPLREQLAEAERKLAKLQAGKAALLGQNMPGTRKPYKTLAMLGRPNYASASCMMIVAKALESGPMRIGELLKIDGIGSRATLDRVMRSCDWFAQVNGPRSAYTLTEAGRNRHKPEAAS